MATDSRGQADRARRPIDRKGHDRARRTIHDHHSSSQVRSRAKTGQISVLSDANPLHGLRCGSLHRGCNGPETSMELSDSDAGGGGPIPWTDGGAPLPLAGAQGPPQLPRRRQAFLIHRTRCQVPREEVVDTTTDTRRGVSHTPAHRQCRMTAAHHPWPLDQRRLPASHPR